MLKTYLHIVPGEGIAGAVEEGQTDPSEALHNGASRQEHLQKNLTSR